MTKVFATTLLASVASFTVLLFIMAPNGGILLYPLFKPWLMLSTFAAAVSLLCLAMIGIGHMLVNAWESWVDLVS